MSKIVGELNAEIMKKVIHDRRAKLFAEIVAKTGSKQSVIDRAMQEIESLREQVEKLTKERDDTKALNARMLVEYEERMQQLVASPVLNRIRAEGMREAAKFVETQRNDIPACGFEFAAAIRARAAELEKTND